MGDKSRNILVTGIQRAGTTWLGRMLSANGNTGYIHEPFNVINKKIHKSPIKFPYDYIDRSQDSLHGAYLDYFCNPRLKFLLKSITGVSHVDSRYISPFRQNLRNFRVYKNKIIKDPFALQACPWLAEQHRFSIVILVRHPAAFALSMKEKKWILNPTAFKITKEKEMQGNTFFAQNLDAYVSIKNKREDLVASAVYGWNLVYSVVNFFKENYPEWLIVRYEDVASDPLSEFPKLYNRLDLDYNKSVSSAISNSMGEGGDNSGVKRDPLTNLNKWKTRLSQEDILRIKKGTEEVWKNFYSEEDWS